MRVRPVDVVDVFVYLVVLGLFIQWFPAVISESFALAHRTAIVLKIVLEVVLRVKKRIVGRIRESNRSAIRVVNVLMLVLVMPGSKFVVLELVDVLFGGRVYLGGFLPVTALIIVLMLARGGVRRLLANDMDPDSKASVTERDRGANS
jgi:hypothetical protein